MSTGIATPIPSHLFHQDLARLVGDIPEASIVSRQVLKNEHLKATLFGFAPGQELSEHTAAKPMILQVISGEGTFGFRDEVVTVGPGSFAYMEPHLPHTVTALTPLVFVLLMLKG